MKQIIILDLKNSLEYIKKVRQKSVLNLLILSGFFAIMIGESYINADDIQILTKVKL